MAKTWQLTWLYRDSQNKIQQGKLEANDYSWLHEQAMKLRAEGCTNIGCRILRNKLASKK